MIAFAIIILILSPFVAHAAGLWAARRLDSQPGQIRDWMPSIPTQTITDGTAQARWEKRGQAVEGRMIRLFKGGVQGASAESVAAELGEDVSVVAAVLARLREEVPSRLQVTRGGKLLHDFSADSIQALSKRRTQGFPARAALFALGVFANIGAAWPMILSITVAVGSLLGMAVSSEPLWAGLGGLITIVGLFAVNAIAGWGIHAIMTPAMSAPRLGAVKEAESREALIEDTQAREYLAVAESGDVSTWLPAGDIAGHGLGGCLSDIDDPRGVLVALVAAALVAVIAGLSFAVLVWLRGIWRAIKRLGVPDLILSPASWIRGSVPVDGVERYIPTNDLVIRVTRAMKRTFLQTHPEDGGMVRRIMSLASRQKGRISALDIALQEGMDIAGATSAGAELMGFLNGRIEVSDDGEIEFVFPSGVLNVGVLATDPDLNAEYLTFQNNKPKRRRVQKERNVPLNIPGLNYGHLVGTDRLVGGTLLMTFCAVALVHIYPDVGAIYRWGVDFIFPLMTLGAFALSGIARYTAAKMAGHGVKRDIRRAGFFYVKNAVKSHQKTVDFTQLAQHLRSVFKDAWKGLKMEDITKELDGVAIDLELELDMQAGGSSVYRVDGLRERLHNLRSWREETRDVAFDFESYEADEVVFDTEIQHEKVRSLR